MRSLGATEDSYGTSAARRLLATLLLVAMTSAMLVWSSPPAWAAYTVSGTVTEGGNAVANGNGIVRAIKLDAEGGHAAGEISESTDANGAFSFTTLEDGATYMVYAVTGTGNSMWQLVVEAASNVNLVVQAPNVSGTLLAPDGTTPVTAAGSSISLRQDGDDRLLTGPSAESGTEGDFGFYVDLNTANLTLVGRPDHSNNPAFLKDSTPVAITSSDSTNKNVLLRNPTLEGFVRASNGTTAVAGSNVNAWFMDEFGNNAEQADWVQSATDGAYGLLIGPPASGTRDVRIQYSEGDATGDLYWEVLLTIAADGTITDEAGSPVTDTDSDGIRNLDLRLVAPNVTGTVSTSDSQPLPVLDGQGPDVEVRIMRSNGDEDMPSQSRSVDPANGSFSLYVEPSELVLGQGDVLELTASPPYGTFSYVASAPQALEMSGGSVSNVVAVLRKPNLGGHVLAPDGTTKTSGASVNILDGDHHLAGIMAHDDLSNGTTEGQYAYYLPAAPSGTTTTYTVRAEPWGGLDRVLSRDYAVTVNDSGDVTAIDGGATGVNAGVGTLNLRLRTPTVTGVVTNPSNAAVGNVNIAVESGVDWYDGTQTIGEGIDTGKYALFLPAPTSGTRVYDLTAQWFDHLVGSSAVKKVEVDSNGQVRLWAETNPPAFSAAPLANVDMQLQPTNVRGVVRTPDGNSTVANAQVELRTEDYSTHLWVEADEHGRFGFVAPNGTYILSAAPAWDSTDPFGRSANVEVAVASGVGPTDLSVKLTSANVTGTVRSAPTEASPTGDPVAFAGVQLRSDDYSYHDWVNADQNGVFRFSVPPGRYWVSADPPWDDTTHGRSVEEELNVDANGVATPANVDLNLTTPNVTGTVVHANDSLLSAGTFVEVWSDDYSYFTHANTDETGGQFRLSLPDGTYSIKAHPPHGDTSGDSASAPARISVSGGVATVVADDNNAAPLVVKLTKPALIGVACHNGTNNTDESSPSNAEAGVPTCGGDDGPAGGGWASLRKADWSFETGVPVDWDTGRYSIGGVPAGDYVLDVYAPWDRSDLQPVTNVAITIGDTTPVIRNAVYAEATSKIFVSVLRPDGTTPITSGFDVFAWNQDGGWAHQDTANGSNQFELLVTDGTWEIMVSASDPSGSYIYSGYPKIVSVNGSATASFKTLEAGSTVQGSVVDPDSVPLVSGGLNSAWVEVRAADGRGNGGELIACPDDPSAIPGSNQAASNCFQVKVPPGTYQVYVYPFNQNYGAPATQTIRVGTNEIVTLDGDAGDGVQPLALTSRDSQIQGRVSYRGGTAVANTEVFAWQPDGGGFAHTLTNSTGDYTLRVSPGDWEIGIWPGGDADWVFDGEPLTATVGSGEIVTDKNFVVTRSIDSLQGRAVLPAPSTATATDIDAYVWAEKLDADLDPTGTGSGAPVINGTFTVPLAEGTYDVHLYLAPGSKYSSPTSARITVDATNGITSTSDGWDAINKRLALHLAANDSSVTGRLVGLCDTQVAGCDGVVVFATNDKGEYVDTWTDFDGNYSLGLPSGTWRVDFHVVDQIGGMTYLAAGLQDAGGAEVADTVTLTGSSVTRNLELVAADRTISGTVTDKLGGHVDGAWVWAESLDTCSVEVHVGTETAPDGTYTLEVPNCDFRVGVAAELDGQLEPAVKKQVASNSTNVDFQFRDASSLSISGVVALNGTGTPATVSAWSDEGGFTEVVAGANGVYSLSVAANDTWHVSAFKNDTTDATLVYVADEVAVPVATTSVPGVDLTLTANTVPASNTYRFDASSMQVITVGSGSNAVTLRVPAGALASSGTVSIVAAPIPKPTTTLSTHPLGLGYSFNAFDGNGTEITSSFSKSVSITFAYDATEVADRGMTPSALIPSYWDETTGTYRRVANATVDTAASTITFSVDHFTDFVVGSATLPAPTVSSVSPSSATQGAVTAITITGAGFRSGATVTVGGTAATGVTVASATSVTATVPGSLAAGAHDVVVTNTDSQSGTRTGGFTVTASSGSTPSPTPTPTPTPRPGAPRAVSETVPAGGSVNTDVDGKGATAAHPLQTSITAPKAGTVSIEEKAPEDAGASEPSGFQLLGRALVISAPASTPEEPIVIGLTVDSTLVTGDGPVAVFRNGVQVPRCDTAGATVASPDPCVTTRTTSGDDLVITVLTSKASVWTVGMLDDTAELEVACPAASTPSGSFSDVPDGATHERGIDCVADWGIALGSGGGYQPAGPVTRGQMATFLARLLEAAGVTLPVDATSRFTDVAGHPHATSVAQLAELGVVRGTSATTFGPNDSVTRGQMASFLVAAFELAFGGTMATGSTGFTDVAAGGTHAAAIGKVVEIGFAQGTSATTYDPADPVTRGQMATFLARMLDRLAAEGFAHR